MHQGEPSKNGGLTLVALGGNAPSQAGEAAATVAAALEKLTFRFNDLRASRLYRTPAFPAGAGPDYVNSAAAFFSDDVPSVILSTLHEIEKEFGRERNQRWGQRTLDLDLIACGDRILPDVETFAHWRDLPLEQQKTSAPQQLILPHPRVQDRSFVLVPLAEVAPDWVHPHSGLSVVQMRDARPVDERAEVTAL